MAQQLTNHYMHTGKFLIWLGNQQEKYELIDGSPVLMAGANQDHNDIVASGLSEFANQLRGKPCRPIGSDTAIQISTGGIRFPDFVQTALKI